MRNFLQRLAYRFQKFMYGRHGNDEFSLFLVLTSLALMLLSRIRVLRFFYLIAIFLLFYSCFRIYSKNLAKRNLELERYRNAKYRCKKFFSLRKRMWAERKTHTYFKCSSCKTMIRVPKGKGRIEVSCPKCGNKTIRNT